MPVAGQRTHGTAFRAPRITSYVATPGAESAVYDCLVIQVCVEPRTTAVNMTLPAVAAPGAVDRQDKQDRQTDRQTDRRTPDRYIDPAPHTMRVASKTLKKTNKSEIARRLCS